MCIVNLNKMMRKVILIQIARNALTLSTVQLTLGLQTFIAQFILLFLENLIFVH